MKEERFEEYFCQYENLVMNMAKKMTGDCQIAAEIRQQVFASLFSNMDKVTPELVKAWLLRCTQNATVDYLRKKKRKMELFSELPQEGDEVIDAALLHECISDCEDRVAKRELAGKILREVRQVNQCWYDVLVLICVEGLSHAEAAQRLCISESVVRARLCRARAYIRQHYGEEYSELL